MTLAQWLEQEAIPHQGLPQELLQAELGLRIRLGKDLYRPGRFLHRLRLYLPLTEEQEASFYRTIERLHLRFGVAYGEEVVRVYAGKPRSCMTGRVDELEVYVENPQVVGVAYLERDGDYVARSLVWLGRHYDRVYATDGLMAKELKRHLEEAGYTPVQDLTVPVRPPALWPYIDSLSQVYTHPDSPYVLLSTREDPVLHWEGKPFVLHGKARSTLGDLVLAHVRLCRLCPNPASEQDEEGQGYCQEHAQHLRWVFQGERVVRRYVEDPSRLVLLEEGYLAEREEAVQLHTGEWRHRSQLPEGYLPVGAGRWKGRYAPAWLLAPYQDTWVAQDDLVEGKLPSFLDLLPEPSPSAPGIKPKRFQTM